MVMRVVVIVKVVVMFDVGVPVPHVIVVRHGVGMGTWEELWINVV